MEAALRRGTTPDVLAEVTGVDPWFVDGLQRITRGRLQLEALVRAGTDVESLDRRTWREVKRLGFSDADIAYLFDANSPNTSGPVDEAAVARRALQQACTQRSRPSTPAVPSSQLTLRTTTPPTRTRTRCARATVPRLDPRVRAEPNRTGHRVRLLLRARLDGTARSGLRDCDGQLQPRDRLD